MPIFCDTDFKKFEKLKDKNAVTRAERGSILLVCDERSNAGNALLF